LLIKGCGHKPGKIWLPKDHFRQRCCSHVFKELGSDALQIGSYCSDPVTGPFKEEGLRAAITASVRVNPVEEMANAATKGVEANKQNIDDTNKRISELNEWDLMKTVTVYFAVNRVNLSPQARATLDEIGPKATQAKDYKVEVAGFADSTGNPQKNLELSQQREDNVVQYLTVKYKVPLRRISTPMGYRATQSVGENSTPEARMRDRRVEIRVLVNKGMSR
jgi:outer membrane protein OmpA-like peptidoglycan-associated protein